MNSVTRDTSAEPNPWLGIKKPNAFVIGAPKCGTTAMCHWLSQHPQVFVSEPKEPHFFAAGEMPRKARRFSSEAEYARIFASAGDEHNAVIEGSIWYLFSQTAIKNIHRFDPEAKLVVMLRRPDEMVYSMHNQAVVNYSEDIMDFNEAWSMALAGNNRASWPELCDVHAKLDYQKIARFHDQLTRVYEYFSKEQVCVIFHDDIKADPRQCFQTVESFLGVKHADVSMDRINESKVVVNRRFGKFLRKPPASLLALNNLIKRITGIKKLGFRDKLKNANTRVVKRTPIDEGTRLQLIEEYREQVMALGELCERDLSDWLK